jgi:hypothetical protein
MRRTIPRLLGIAGVWLLVVGLILAAMPQSAAAQTDTGTTPAKPGGPYVVLTGDFFEAMEKLSRANENTYGDRQDPFLEQIAVASKFMVKTNLTLIKQNERIIHLLEELNRKRPLQEK